MVGTWLGGAMLVLLAGEPDNTWVFELPAKIVPCGRGSVLAWKHGETKVFRQDPDGHHEALPLKRISKVLDLARTGDDAWLLVQVAGPRKTEGPNRVEGPLHLARVDCASDTPKLHRELTEVPGISVNEHARPQLLLPNGKPWVARTVGRTESGQQLWDIAVGGKTGAVHRVHGDRFHAMHQTEQTLVYETVRGRATVRDLELPTAIVFADRSPQVITATGACRDIVSGFGTHAKSQAPVLYRGTPDDAYWNAEAFNAGDAPNWTLEVCVVHWQDGTESIRRWSTQMDNWRGANIQIWPVDRTYAWVLMTDEGTPPALRLLDIESNELQAIELRDAAYWSDKTRLIPGNDHHVFLEDRHDIVDLAPPRRIDSLGLSLNGDRLRSLWRRDGEVWAISVRGEILRADSDLRILGISQGLTPCAQDHPPELIDMQRDHGWGTCNGYNSFGIVTLDDRAAREQTRFELKSDALTLDTEGPAPASVPCSAFDGNFQLAVWLPDKRESRIQRTVRLSIEGGGTIIKAERSGYGQEAPTPLDEVRCEPGPGHIMEWSYTDWRGSRISGTWGPFELTGSGWSRWDIVTPLLAGMSVLFSALWLFLRLLPGWLRGGGFLALIGASAALPFFVHVPRSVLAYDALLGLELHLAGLGLMAVSCLLLPRLFWRVASAPPISLLARVSLRFAVVRRRQFGHIVRATRDDATKRLRGEFGKKYHPLPVNCRIQEKTEQTSTPVEWLRNRFDAKIRGVLIEGESGTGKSFLLRQVLLDGCKQFADRKTDRVPLLLAQPRRDTDDPLARPHSVLARLAVEKLASHGIPRDVATALVQGGGVFLAVDGLSEGDLDPLQIQTARDEMAGTVLVATARPSSGLREVFVGPGSVVAETQPLTEDNLEGFCQAICSRTLPKLISDVIRDSSGSYRPILVVIALSLGDAAVKGIPDIFERCFAQMVAKSAAGTSPFSATLELCLRTYWGNGERTFMPRAADASLIRVLLDANILHPASVEVWRSGTATLPRRVRFFHDLMQTYLTAHALVHEFADQTQQRQEVLLTAAAHPDFGARGEAGDLFLAWVGSIKHSLLAKDLEAILNRWIAEGDRVDERVKKGAVIEAMPPDLQQKVRTEASGHGTVEALRIAAQLSEQDTAVRTRLVAQVALQVVPAKLYGPPDWGKPQPEIELARLLAEIYDNDAELRKSLVTWSKERGLELRSALPGVTTSIDILAQEASEWIERRGLTREFCEYLQRFAPARYIRELRLLAETCVSPSV